MTFSKAFSIRSRLLAAFSLLLILSVLQGAIVMWAQQKAIAAVTKLTDTVVVQQQLLNQAQEAVNESARAMTQYLLVLDFPLADEFRSQAEFSRRAANEAFNVLLNTLQRSEVGEQTVQLRLVQSEFDAMLDKVGSHIQAGKNELAVGLWVRDSAGLLSKVTKSMQAARVILDQDYSVSVADIKRQLVVTAWVIGCTLVVSLIGTIVLALLLTSALARPVKQALSATEALAQGQLYLASDPLQPRGAADAQSPDEFSRLQSALNIASANLRRTIERIRLASDSVRDASEEIAQGNEELMERSEQQTGTLFTTSQLLEDLAGAVQRNTEAARTANDIAAKAAKAAERGGQAMGQVVTKMKEIHRSSKQIAEVTGLIDSIAFQTNILALNAAVEAARAGPAGRGFAVVASEVRILAQRSAQAAREIKTLIALSVECVDGGEQMVAGAGDSIQELVSRVQEVSSLIFSISSASNGQESSLAQISGSMGQLETMATQATAMVERHAKTSQGLLLQAEGLSEAVSVFKLERA